VPVCKPFADLFGHRSAGAKDRPNKSDDSKWSRCVFISSHDLAFANINDGFTAS
jgi:hypothetical protein